jgi:hypothetical protein
MAGRKPSAIIDGSVREGVGKGAPNVDSYDVSHGARKTLSNLSNLPLLPSAWLERQACPD